MFNDSKKRNQALKCAYHKDYGHKTKNYKTLKPNLEELVQAGHLNNFLKKKKGTAQPIHNQALGIILDDDMGRELAIIYGGGQDRIMSWMNVWVMNSQ